MWAFSFFSFPCFVTVECLLNWILNLCQILPRDLGQRLVPFFSSVARISWMCFVPGTGHIGFTSAESPKCMKAIACEEMNCLHLID